MPPEYRDEYRGPDFFARTIYGDPLPPGEYLAVLDIRGLTRRLEYRVTVTRREHPCRVACANDRADHLLTKRSARRCRRGVMAGVGRRAVEQARGTTGFPATS